MIADQFFLSHILKEGKLDWNYNLTETSPPYLPPSLHVCVSVCTRACVCMHVCVRATSPKEVLYQFWKIKDCNIDSKLQYNVLGRVFWELPDKDLCSKPFSFTFKLLLEDLQYVLRQRNWVTTSHFLSNMAGVAYDFLTSCFLNDPLLIQYPAISSHPAKYLEKKAPRYKSAVQSISIPPCLSV